jgi:predicted MFS family arabinose efflux permease
MSIVPAVVSDSKAGISPTIPTLLEEHVVPRDHSRGSSAYFLGLLAIIAASLEADRYLFSIALEPIKHEFGLSDSQLGAINGLAFAIFYAIAAIPIARTAGKIGGKPVIVASIAAWSAFTALTAAATGFAYLFLSRILVGIGEAGSMPALQSLIADRFRPEQRPAALSTLFAGNYLGMLLGMAVGGAIVEAGGWRNAFLAMGIFGVVLAPLVWSTLRAKPPARVDAPNNLTADLVTIVAAPGMGHFITICCLMQVTTTATLAWTPAFYSRYFGMNAAEAGISIGLIFGGGAFAGTLCGGAWLARITRIRKDAAMSFILWTTVACTLPSIFAFAVNSSSASLLLLFLSVILSALPAGALTAILLELVEPRHRSVAVAVVMMLATMVGGVGPFVTGLISDLPLNGSRSLGLGAGLVVVNCLNVWTLFHIWKLTKTYRRHFGCD